MFFLLFFSRSEAPEQEKILEKLVVGEWNIFESKKVNKSEPIFTAEIHEDIISKKLVGSVWRNTAGNQENRIHTIDEAEIAQFAIVAGLNQLSGKIIDLNKEGKVITSFAFKPTVEGAVVTKGKLDDQHSFNLKVFNNSDIKLYVSETGKSDITEYVIRKPIEIAKESFFGKYQTIAYILIGVFAVQLILLCCCTISKNKLLNQLEEAQGTKLKSVKAKKD